MHWNHKRVIDGLLILTACGAPFLLGGRYAAGRLAFVALAAVTAICYAIHFTRQPTARWRHTAAQWLLAAAALVVVVQLVPLPPSILKTVHPSLEERLPLWTGQDAPGTMGAWNQASLYPRATLGGLAMLGACAAVFLVAVQRFETLESIERIVWWIAIGVLIMAAAGLLQYLMDNGKFLWIYEHPFRNPGGAVTGGFDNKNHFAHFMVLGLGPLIWWLVGALQRSRDGHGTAAWHVPATQPLVRKFFQTPYVPLIGLGILIFAGLMSKSRGGVLVMLLASAICIAILYRSGRIRGKTFAALATVCVVAAVGLSVHGLDRVMARLGDFTAGSIDDLDHKGMRRAVWAANLAATSDNLLLGAGVGTHQYLIPMYLDQHFPTEFSHAESGYLQVLTETGLAGGFVLLGALALCGWWCWRSLRYAPSARHLAITAAVVSGISASVVHSIWDFPWYIPGLMTLTCLLAACLCRLASLTAATHPGHAAPASTAQLQLRWAGLAATIAAGVWSISICTGPALASAHWDSYLRRSVALQAEQESLNVRTDVSDEEKHARDVLRIDAMVADLESAIRHDPANSRFHLRLAGKLLARYDLALRDAPNEMPVNQLRDASTASAFPTVRELHEWVERAVGAEAKSYVDRSLEHVRLALRQTPLEAEGYLRLADLAFLEGASPDDATAYLDQARRANPHDGDVLIRAGADAYLRQEYEEAIGLWQAAHRTGPAYQRKMIILLAGRVPIGFILEKFQPDLEILHLMEFHYSQLELPQEVAEIQRYAAARAVAAARQAEKDTPHNAGKLWLKAHVYYRKLQEDRAAAACGKRALVFSPQDYGARQSVGRFLLQMGDFAEAEKHLQWCVDHRPEDERLRQELRRAMAGRMRLSAEAADGLPAQ